MALLSWSSVLSPALPLIGKAPMYSPNPTQRDYQFGGSHPVMADKSESAARNILAKHHKDLAAQWDDDNDEEARRVNGSLATEDAISQHLSEFPLTSR
jgi:hypothetical protein